MSEVFGTSLAKQTGVKKCTFNTKDIRFQYGFAYNRTWRMIKIKLVRLEHVVCALFYKKFALLAALNAFILIRFLCALTSFLVKDCFT